MYFIQGREENHKESGGVFPSVDNVGKQELRVAISPQTLGKAEPRRQAGHNSSHAVLTFTAD